MGGHNYGEINAWDKVVESEKWGMGSWKVTLEKVI